MQVAEQPADLLDRFDILVDPDAEPADLDEALAEFLLTFVRNQSTPAGSSTADGSRPQSISSGAPAATMNSTKTVGVSRATNRSQADGDGEVDR